MLSIQVSTNFGTYLGIPIATGRMTMDRYQFLLDKIKSRLNGWQANFLSAVGRTTLANSVLTSLPSHMMQTTLIPSEIFDAIDQQV